jgi:hypothetical protein
MAEEKESGGAEWMQKLWRPAMGWMYMVICLLDMAIFPVLWSILQAVMHVPITQWNPLTLQGAGLFHIAMGAVLGISAFGRTQEKLAGTAANPTTAPTTAPTPSFGGSPSGFNSSPSTSFTPAPSWGTTPTAPAASGFGGGGFGSTPPTTTASGKKIVPDFGQPVI